MPEWGNGNGDQFNTNLIPTANRHNRLQVVDVDTNDVDQPAIWAVNANAGANALALRVNGRSLLDGPVTLGQDGGGGEVTFDGEIQANSEAHFNELLVAEGAALVAGNLTCEEDVTMKDTCIMQSAKC